LTPAARQVTDRGVNSVTSGVARVGELDLAYDTRGAGEPLLLVAGFGMTRAMWSDELSDKLAGRGLQVVRMDNRDTGGSTRLTKLGVPDVPRLFLRSMLGRTVTPLYTIEDMARDAVGLMKSLGHGRFHVVGASMGGMIAQTIALEHPATLASMTSIMSTPGGRRYSFASLGALRGIMQRVPQDPKEQVEHFVRVFRVIAGDGIPFDEARARVTAEALAAAKPSTAGSARQFAAILDSSGRRRRRLPEIKTPTLIIHGTHDPLLPVRGSRAMARLITGSELLVVEGMGHLIPATLYDRVVDAIHQNTRKPGTRAA
jgi:pimeloyl-ACP methyl ester carboxylesterase